MEKDFSQIDKLFNSKLNNYEISDKKGNWELMRHLIKEQQKKTMFFHKIKLMAFGGGGIVLLFSVILFLNNERNKITTIIEKKQSNIVEYKKNTATYDNKKQVLHEIEITNSSNEDDNQLSANSISEERKLMEKREAYISSIKQNKIYNQNYSKNYIDNNVYQKNE